MKRPAIVQAVTGVPPALPVLAADLGLVLRYERRAQSLALDRKMLESRSATQGRNALALDALAKLVAFRAKGG